MKWTVTLSTTCLLALSGCAAIGEAGGTRTFRDAAVPFVFDVPAEFTAAPVDAGDSRGDVVAAAGVTKVDVIAVRRGRALDGPQPHRTLGKDVVSELHAVPGQPGWVLECQYTPERAADVRSACRAALESVRRR